MTLVNISNKDIYMTKGDTIKLTLNIFDKSGNNYEMSSGDIITMTIRSSKKHKSIISLESKNKDIVINPSDTKGLSIGDYEYDIQLTFKNGDINTIIPIHKFVLLGEVS